MAIPAYRYLHCEQCGWRNKPRVMSDVLYPPGTCPKCDHDLKWKTSGYHPPSLRDFYESCLAISHEERTTLFRK